MMKFVVLTAVLFGVVSAGERGGRGENDISATCTIDDVIYLEGDTVPDADPCKKCICVPELPEPMCRMTRCRTSWCPNGAEPQEVPGECCARCLGEVEEGCVVDGTRYAKGQLIPSRDPCETCWCHSVLAERRCHRMRCEWPRCSPGEYPVTSPRICCPYCPSTGP